MKKEYVLNRETGKIELHFSKEEYKSLSKEQQQELKRYFNFSGTAKAWVSKSKNNHYMAIQVAKKLGFVDGGKIGERLSFAEELERQAEKAEAKAERFEQYAENAEKRAEGLQSEFNECRKDWSWLTQPNINSSKGRSFTNQRNRIMARYEKGFDEYRKSAYFQERAVTAKQTADMSKMNNKTYLNNRIEECNKEMRQLERSIITAEENNNEQRLENLLERMEYEMDKLAYFHNAMDELGGVQYSKDNIKPGYLVMIRRDWGTVVKANAKTVEVQFSHVPYTLKYAYADIQDLKIPEGWTEPKNSIENPFNVGDILVAFNIAGDRILYAFQVVKITAKSITIQQIKVENNTPIANEFINDTQERRAFKKNRQGVVVVDHYSWRLYKYEKEEQKAVSV